MAVDTMTRLTEAARVRLLADGYAKLSTRRVAEQAGVPLSQIHYHFGGRQGLVLALLATRTSDGSTARREMYAADVPLSQRYDQACDFLEEDLASGYVRVLQEMIAAGWSDPAVADQVTTMLGEWFDLLDRGRARGRGAVRVTRPFPRRGDRRTDRDGVPRRRGTAAARRPLGRSGAHRAAPGRRPDPRGGG